MRRRIPIRAGDQRYWRSRANRRVRKVRRMRTLARWALILSIDATLLVALGYTAAQVVERLRTSSEFSLRRIELTGVRRAPQERILTTLRRHLGHSLLDLDLDRIEREVRDDPWVRAAAVRRILPGTICVRIDEREPAAVAVIRGRTHLVDTTGFVIGPVGVRTSEPLPLLTGLDGMDDERLRIALRRGTAMLVRLERASPSFASTISELDLSRGGVVTARTNDDRSRILLDPRRVERNLNRFLALREEIRRTAGPAEYIDLRWKDRISVMPTSQRSVGDNG